MVVLVSSYEHSADGRTYLNLVEQASGRLYLLGA